MPPKPPESKGPQLLTPRIKCSEVRLIDGDEHHILTRAEAEQMAEERGLDLVVMNLSTSPPVVKLADYGKFKFEAEKKAREAKKKQHVTAIKEIKMGIRIDDHDYGVKTNRARQFLLEGDIVKCSIRLKGREVQHSSLAFDLARRFVADLENVGALQGMIRLEGARNITLHLNPTRAAAPKPSEAAAKQDSDDA
ncbi:MAG: translation initiation factor IF-3 [Vampirovibrionales bacterium]|nr:translation initiation factor IF-3 [Vampirovibrionales bacterium]